MIDLEKISTISACSIMAWMINCDNAASEFTDTTFTGRKVFSSNSHGELYGVISTWGLVKNTLSKLQDREELLSNIQKIINEENVEVNSKMSTGLGMMIMCSLYNVSEEFKAISLQTLELYIVLNQNIPTQMIEIKKFMDKKQA